MLVVVLLDGRRLFSITLPQSFLVQSFSPPASSTVSEAVLSCAGVGSTTFGLKKFLIVTSGVVAFVKVLGLIGASASSYAWLAFDESLEGPAIPKTSFCFS